MNHYSTKRRESDSKWDYTFSSRRTGIHPIGYCAGWKEYSHEERLQVPMNDYEWEKIQSYRDKYHSNGHETDSEAQACYRQYLLDTRMRLNKTTDDQQHKCQICDGWTQGYAEVDNSFFFRLCDVHMSIECVTQLMPSIGESWSSY